jgi:hypothetical protein
MPCTSLAVRRIALVCSLAGTLPAGATAQSASGLLVLQNPASVRAAGLGGAGAALLGDAGALFANPAALALVRYVSLEASYHGAPFDAYQATGALGLRLGQLDLGAGLQYFDYGSEPEMVPDPATGGVTGLPTGATVAGREFLAAGTLTYRIGMLALGGSVKAVGQRVSDLTDRGVTGDLGLALAIFDLAAFGVAVQNLGGNWTDASRIVLPGLTRVGFTMNYVDPQESWRLLSTVELQWPEGAGVRALFGVEGGLVVSGVGVLLRGAYASRPAGADLSRLATGGSVTMGGLSVDYAFTPMTLLDGGEHRVGVRLRL